MFIVFFILLPSAFCIAMQPTSTFASYDVYPSVQLQKYGQRIASMRASLWPIQGVLVSYQSNKEQYTQTDDFHALDCHHNNIKRLLHNLCAECDNACKALSFLDLHNLIQHTQSAQQLFNHLSYETIHFEKIIAKRFPRSKM